MSPTSREGHSGGCQCGAVRFHVARLGRPSICHCRMCQKAFGGFFGQLGEGRKASWLLHPAFSVLLSSFLFALAHGAGQDIPIFFDRLAFGIVAATLVVVTGGLEAGIAMHVLNNWLAFGAALAFGDMGSALNPTGGTWWSIPVTLTQSLVYLGLAWWVAHLMGIRRRTDPAVLAAPETRV